MTLAAVFQNIKFVNRKQMDILLTMLMKHPIQCKFYAYAHTQLITLLDLIDISQYPYA